MNIVNLKSLSSDFKNVKNKFILNLYLKKKPTKRKEKNVDHIKYTNLVKINKLTNKILS